MAGQRRPNPLRPVSPLAWRPFGWLAFKTANPAAIWTFFICSMLKFAARTLSTVVMVTHEVDEAVLLSDRIDVLTNGSAAAVRPNLPVTLPRPRNRVELAEDSSYGYCRKELLDFLYRRHRDVKKMAA